MQPKTIMLIVVGVLISILLLQNAHHAQFSFFFWHIELPQIVMLIFFFVAGVGIGFLIRKKKSQKKI
jgi:uncharacterized integral membrane protein